MRALDEFVRKISGVSDEHTRTIMDLSFSVPRLFMFSLINTAREGVGLKAAAIMSLTRLFKPGFLRDVFDVLIVMNWKSDLIAEASGLVASAFMLKTIHGGEEVAERPSFMTTIKVDTEVYAEIYERVKQGVIMEEERSNITLGEFGNAVILLLSVITTLMIIGLSLGVKALGYPDGVMAYLDYALTQSAGMALSEMFST